MTHFIRPAAKDDILRQFRYYLLRAKAPQAAVRFVDAVDETIAPICNAPNAGSPKILVKSIAGRASVMGGERV